MYFLLPVFLLVISYLEGFGQGHLDSRGNCSEAGGESYLIFDNRGLRPRERNSKQIYNGQRKWTRADSSGLERNRADSSGLEPLRASSPLDSARFRSSPLDSARGSWRLDSARVRSIPLESARVRSILLAARASSSRADSRCELDSSPRFRGCLEPSPLESRSGLGSSRLVNNTNSQCSK